MPPQSPSPATDRYRSGQISGVPQVSPLDIPRSRIVVGFHYSIHYIHYANLHLLIFIYIH